MPKQKTKIRSAGSVVIVPKSILAKLDAAEKNYPTNVAFCKALDNITPNKLRHLRGYERCLSSTLHNLELALSKLKK